MLVDELEAMFKRRGYTVFRYPQDEERPSLVVLRISRGEWQIVRAHDLHELQQIVDPCFLVEYDLLALSNGQHHMRCACGFPLLRARFEHYGTRTHFGEAWDGGKLGPQFGAIMEWEPVVSYHYRTVSAGPDSLPITACPQCGGELQQTAREIED